MKRRQLLAAGWLLAGSLLTASPSIAAEPSLEDTLKFGLRARRPIEFQFVSAVASLTNSGYLPKDYVLASFDYARQRRPKFPMPYFEFAVRKKAAELGVDIGVPNTLAN